MTDRSRRTFVQQGLATLAAMWTLPPAAWADAARAAERHRPGTRPAGAPDPVPEALTAAEIRTFEAISARIVPTDATPGARDAGAVWFVDRLLARWAPEQRPVVAAALAACDREAVARGAADFAALGPADQDAVLAAAPAERRQLFVQLTCAGLLAPPEHGGNRDGIGWALIGHDPAMAFTSPYGYYDAPETLARLVAEARAARARETR